VVAYAHVPRDGLRPSLLLYFATATTPGPGRTTVFTRRRGPRWCRVWTAGRSAQRS